MLVSGGRHVAKESGHLSRGDGRRDIYSLDRAPAVKALLSGNLVRAACLALTLLAGAGCTGVSKDFDAAIQERIRTTPPSMRLPDH